MSTTCIQAQRGRGRQKANFELGFEQSRAKATFLPFTKWFWWFFSLSQAIDPQTEPSCASGFFSRKQGFGGQRRHQDRLWHDQSHCRCGHWSYRGLRNSVESPQRSASRGWGSWGRYPPALFIPGRGLLLGSEFPSTQPCMWAEGAAAATVRAHLGSAVRSCQKRWWVRGAHEWDTQRKFSGLELHLLYDSLCVCVYLVSVCVWTYTCTYKHIYLSVLSVYVSGRKQKKVSNGYLYMYNSIH